MWDAESPWRRNRSAKLMCAFVASGFGMLAGENWEVVVRYRVFMSG